MASSGILLRWRYSVIQAGIWAVLPALFTFPSRASDIPGDIVPEDCVFVGGVLFSGPPSCAGPLHISVARGSNADLSFNGAATGTLADPWLIGDSITGGSLALGLTGGFGPVFPFDPDNPGNHTGSHHAFARYFSATVKNTSVAPWTGFRLELETILEAPSTEEDSLSFGQVRPLVPTTLFLPPVSDRFGLALPDNSSARDAINFSHGTVEPGESVKFGFLISYNTPLDTFYLIERPATVPEPGTIFLVAAGFGVLLLARRRKSRLKRESHAAQ